MQWSKSSKNIFESEDPISRYKAHLEMTHKKRLLVEGKTDKILFNNLFKEIFNKTNQKLSKDDILIDYADILTGFSNSNHRLGNREKVELVCQKLEGESCASKLVGFVDREFRDFNICALIQDTLLEHKVQGQLVWSRGHSMENYFFDFSILCSSLTNVSLTEWLDDALEIFENLFLSTIRLACAISLAAEDVKYINPVQKSINWEIIEISDLQLYLQTDCWKKSLIKNQKLTNESVEKIIERYIYWNPIIENTDFSILRWICHGHIGIKTILSVYIRCVHEVCRVKFKIDFAQASKNSVSIDKEINEAAFKQADRLQKQIEEDLIPHNCGLEWSRKVIENQVDYPLRVFTFLGIRLP